jgi:hypothetical protein
MGTEKTGTDTAGKSYLLPIANSQTIRESNRGGIIGPKTVLNNQYETNMKLASIGRVDQAPAISPRSTGPMKTAVHQPDSA